MMRFVTAFNRDRDHYQLPLALKEGDALARLVTDLYLPDVWVGSNFAKLAGLAHRTCPGLPSRFVRSSAGAVWRQMVNLRLARSAEARIRVFRALDATLSRIAGLEAAKAGSGLFLYSGYALEAFSMPEHRETKKLLFVYHPQGEYVRAILEADAEIHPEVAASHEAHLQEIRINEGERVRQELELADAAVCASSFTAASVKACSSFAGKILRVVPYGCTPAADHRAAARETTPSSSGKPKVLFVGQGVQRKGLHHLLKAWRAGGLWKVADLTLVLSSVDPGIKSLAAALPVPPRILSRLTKAELDAEYRRSDIFALPSLVEGFGLVYLEALSSGCFVIGTTNTGLPDLGLGPEAVCLSQPGDIEGLTGILIKAINAVSAGEIDRERIKMLTSALTWSGFRDGIRHFVREAEGQAKRQVI